MSDKGAAIQFQEYSDLALPEPLRIQVLSFLRIIWPDGFTGPNRFRDRITDPALQPRHLLYAAGAQLISHLEIITATVRVNEVEYLVQSPTSVLTYPAFRGEGWSSRLNDQAAERIDNGGADIGILTCAPDLIDFYGRAGWTHVPAAKIVAGPDGDTSISNDVLLTRPTSQKHSPFIEALSKHPLRMTSEW